MECKRKQRVKDDFEVFGLSKWGNDNAIYGDGKHFEMVVDEGMCTERNKSSIFVLY